MAEEPRKLFKTISLEERLASSEYNRLPNKLPASSNTQGSPQINKSAEPQDKNSDNINIPQSQLTLPKEGIVLKGAIGVEDKQPIILKTLVQSPQALLSPPRPFNTTPLLDSTRPLARTQFASSISLEDRLRQSNITSTRHLPQYFLSDLYTGYLTITPFITLPVDRQDIGQIPAFLTTTIESTQDVGRLDEPSENVINRQDPKVDIQESKSNILILTRQGTFTSNNVVNSVVELTDPKSIVQISQGEIELPIWNYVAEQGITLNETTPIGDIQIAVLQGMIVENSLIQGSAIDINTDPAQLQIENLPIPGSGQIAVDVFEQNKNIAFNNPLAFHGTVELGTAQYDADKQQSIDSPLTRHGQVQLSVNNYLVSRTLAFASPAVFHGTEIINPFVQDLTEKEDQKPNVGTEPYTPQANIPLPPEYSAIVGLGDSYNQGRPTGESALEDTAPSVQTSTSPAADPRKKLDDPLFSDTDLLNITITPEGGSAIRIKAYLTAFSDGITANWTDINYIGRQDTLKQFTGATRAVSFAVLMPSFNSVDVSLNILKLERIINATVVGSFNPGDVYLTAPLARLRIGGLINSYVAFSSVKWDFDPTEATFDIDKGLPHLLKVSFDCAVLSTSLLFGRGRLLNGAEGGYFPLY